MRLRVRPIVTQLALMGRAIYSTRDGFRRDIVLAGSNVSALPYLTDRYLQRKKGRS